MINISELNEKKVSKKQIDVTLDVVELQDSYEKYTVLKPLKVIGELNSVGEIISLEGKVTGVLELTCSRCLKNFNYDIQLDINEKLTNNPENKDDEIIFINNDKLNLTEIVENNIIMSLPIQRLCQEDCKGLCASCGSDLNLGECKCQHLNIDPRLAKLKDLFSND